MENPEAVTLWSTILWMGYGELALEVQEWLQASAKDARKEDVDQYLSVIELELEVAKRGLEETEKELVGYDISSAPEQKVIAFKAKVDGLKKAERFLKSL